MACSLKYFPHGGWIHSRRFTAHPFPSTAQLLQINAYKGLPLLARQPRVNALNNLSMNNILRTTTPIPGDVIKGSREEKQWWKVRWANEEYGMWRMVERGLAGRSEKWKETEAVRAWKNDGDARRRGQNALRTEQEVRRNEDEVTEGRRKWGGGGAMGKRKDSGGSGRGLPFLGRRSRVFYPVNFMQTEPLSPHDSTRVQATEGRNGTG